MFCFVRWVSRWARSWISTLSIHMGWAQPITSSANIHRLCRRIRVSSATNDPELLDLLNLPMCRQDHQGHPCNPQTYELVGNGAYSISDLISDTGCDRSLIIVARRSKESTRDSPSAIPTLFSSSNLEQIVFLECRLDDNDIIKISKAVASGCAKLKSLAMPHNLISCARARHLVTGLQIHGGVQRLDLSFNRCGDDGAEYFAFLLWKSRALRVLRLRGNNIQSRGAIALANAVIQRQANMPQPIPCVLDELDLACNSIGDGGAEAFAAVLRRDCALRMLDVSYNSITIAGARRLSSAVEGNRTLDSLLVRAVARNRGEQSELAALQQRHACGPANHKSAHRRLALHSLRGES